MFDGSDGFYLIIIYFTVINVIPAKAGIQGRQRFALRNWTPAFAGVTVAAGATLPFPQKRPTSFPVGRQSALGKTLGSHPCPRS